MVTQFDPANEYTAQDAVLVLEDGQVYVAPGKADVARPKHELKGFSY